MPPTYPRGISDFGLVTAKLRAKPDFGFSTHPPDEKPQITQMDADITAHSPPALRRALRGDKPSRRTPLLQWIETPRPRRNFFEETFLNRLEEVATILVALKNARIDRLHRNGHRV